MSATCRRSIRASSAHTRRAQGTGSEGRAVGGISQTDSARPANQQTNKQTNGSSVGRTATMIESDEPPRPETAPAGSGPVYTCHAHALVHARAHRCTHEGVLGVRLTCERAHTRARAPTHNRRATHTHTLAARTESCVAVESGTHEARLPSAPADAAKNWYLCRLCDARVPEYSAAIHGRRYRSALKAPEGLTVQGYRSTLPEPEGLSVQGYWNTRGARERHVCLVVGPLRSDHAVRRRHRDLQCVRACAQSACVRAVVRTYARRR